ncbi:MAG: hypothetical protein SCARUB_02080 [Candidatus Scalindua rubra]|uniref:Uncharacterized protein n=1 Tax=Candidatus Scalindua rubra TaxID=1872076 RepID=A0A1E3XAY2_9BACT|nr:MAG: hypothetical protein SCARUB_02080 [Candidatus Scalindua rubra]
MLKVKQIIYCILLLFVALFFLSIITNDFITNRDINRLKDKIQDSFDLQMTDDQAQLGLIELNSMTTDRIGSKLSKVASYVLPYFRNSELHYNFSRYYERIIEVLLANKQKLVAQNQGELNETHILNPQSTICNLISDFYPHAISECRKAIYLNPAKSDYHVKLAQLYISFFRVSSIEHPALNPAYRSGKRSGTVVGWAPPTNFFQKRHSSRV